MYSDITALSTRVAGDLKNSQELKNSQIFAGIEEFAIEEFANWRIEEFANHCEEFAMMTNITMRSNSRSQTDVMKTGMMNRLAQILTHTMTMTNNMTMEANAFHMRVIRIGERNIIRIKYLQERKRKWMYAFYFWHFLGLTLHCWLLLIQYIQVQELVEVNWRFVRDKFDI